MSKPRPDLPNSSADALVVIKRYWNSGLFSKVFVVASRSPKSRKQPSSESDWDFYFISKSPNVRIPSLRLTRQLHGDIVVVYEGDFEKILRKDLVEVYPTDEHGILNEKLPIKKGAS